MNDNNDKNEKQKKEAIALSYDEDKDNAPRIIAKGEGNIADKILETARKNNIPVQKDQDIIKALAQFNIGDEIPPELYQVIAEILSFIYRLEQE